MSSEELKKQGNAALSSKDFNKAVDFYSQAIDIDSSNHILYSNRSAAYASLGNFDDALADAEKCVELNKSWAKGYSRLGMAHYGLHNYDEAISAYETALNLEPGNAQYQQSLDQAKESAAHSSQTNQNPFLQFLPKLMTHPKTKNFFNDPSFLTTLQSGLANPTLMFSDPRMKAVMEVMTEDLNLNQYKDDFEEPPKQHDKPPPPKQEQKKEQPKNAEFEGFKERGNAAYKKKDFAEALRNYEECLRLDPDNITVYNNIAAVHLEQQEYKLCVKKCKEAIDRGRELHVDSKIVARAMARIGTAKLKSNKIDKALDWYKRSLSEFRDPEIVKKVQKIEKDRKEQERLSQLNPELAEAERNEGNKCFANGNFSQAIQHYTESIKRNPQDPRVYSNRAACFTKLMEYSLCIRDCDECIKLDPAFIKAHLRKGNAFLALKQPFNAEKCFKQAITLDSACAEAKDGINSCRQMKSSLPDEERKKQALDDVEVQAILNDPAMRMILEEMQSNPKAAMSHMSDPVLSKKLQVLFEAGILGIR